MEGLPTSQLLGFFAVVVCKVLTTKFVNNCVPTETRSHYTASGCAVWPVYSPDNQDLGKKIRCVVTIKRVCVE